MSRKPQTYFGPGTSRKAKQKHIEDVLENGLKIAKENVKHYEDTIKRAKVELKEKS